MSTAHDITDRRCTEEVLRTELVGPVTIVVLDLDRFKAGGLNR